MPHFETKSKPFSKLLQQSGQEVAGADKGAEQEVASSSYKPPHLP
jgi:hypothetical protein